MKSETKREIVEAFFDEFETKVARLRKMYAGGFKDEAFTLCLVYIDRLASGYYGGKEGKNRENFCRALRERSGDPLFAMLHPRELSEQVQQHFPDALSVIASLTAPQPHTLLEESTVAAAISSSALDASKKQKLIEKLWRASIGSICYERIRGPAIHGAGSVRLDFDKTVYQGKIGLRIDFDLVYRALSKISAYVRRASPQSKHWFNVW